MSTQPKKPSVATTATPGGRKPATDPALAPASPSRGPSRSPPATTANGVARTRSVRGVTPLSARAAVQKPGSSNLGANSAASEAEEQARAERAAVIDDLKDQLRKSQNFSDQFQKHAVVLQSRLDESLSEQGKLEERIHESEERLEALENEKRDALRQKREMESIYEGERSSMMKEREESANREEEMQTIIQRLKDSLSQRSSADEEHRLSRRSNNSSPVESHFAPTSGLNRSDSRNNSKLLLQKDRVIESLRLELAEAQIKLVENEHKGGGRMQEVERLLLEARMTNARLMEDNESYQLLLSQKTLTGDFQHSEFMGAVSNADALNALEGRSMGTSLADELSMSEDGEQASVVRRLENELKASKAENKALTLYINKIIERLLQHQDFEAILDQSSDFKPNTGKELPPPPPEKDEPQGMLQRAKSVAMSARPRPRPQTVMPTTNTTFTNPETAPSIPFGLSRTSSTRGTGRPTRPKSEQYTGGAATVVNQMYRGSDQMSPPLHGPQTPRHSQSFFAPPAMAGNPNAAARAPTASSQNSVSGNFPGHKSETSSVSGESGEIHTPSNSPPREKATFGGNKPRPLRLVADHAENTRKINSEEMAAKRTSWMGGWFGAKKEESPSEESIQE